MKLFIARHGEKENDTFSSNLTSLGEQQVKTIVKTLQEENITNVYTSSNPRSIQTGEIISKEIHVPITTINEIKELPKEIFFQEEHEWNSENKQIITSLTTFLNDICEKKEDVVLAMHAGINRAILSLLLQIPLNKTIHFTQDHACLNILEFKEIYGKERWCVRLLNSTNHLT